MKCPYCVKDKEVTSVEYLKKNEDVCLNLDKSHEYYYQIQMQLGVTKKELDTAFFVVWSRADMHVERLNFNEITERAQHYFGYAVLPKLMGKFFTQVHPLSDMKTPARRQKIKLYCRRKMKSYGASVGNRSSEAWFAATSRTVLFSGTTMCGTGKKTKRGLVLQYLQESKGSPQNDRK